MLHQCGLCGGLLYTRNRMAAHCPVHLMLCPAQLLISIPFSSSDNAADWPGFSWLQQNIAANNSISEWSRRDCLWAVYLNAFVHFWYYLLRHCKFKMRFVGCIYAYSPCAYQPLDPSDWKKKNDKSSAHSSNASTTEVRATNAISTKQIFPSFTWNASVWTLWGRDDFFANLAYKCR